MMQKLIIFCLLIVYAIAILPLNPQLPPSPPNGNRKSMHFLAKSIMEKKLKEPEYRLPRHTVPRVYIIDLDPDFLGEKFTYKGNSTIILEVLRPTTTIIVHRSDKMDIDKQATELINDNGDIEKPSSQIWNPKNNFYTMKFDSKLQLGNYTLKMSWIGRDGADDSYREHTGFYRTADKDENDEDKYLVTTHFEPVYARSLFPCWDEPGIKAQFEFSLVHYPNYTALSNMPIKSREELPDNKVLTKFERSPVMSPYLPCLAVADYKPIKNIHGNITFYGQESALDSLKYALEVSEKVIPSMELYTGVPYALPKLDQITIPEYSATAMEHWGLVSYVTRSVLSHNATFLPHINKNEQIEILIAHELSHQWFGNLVTPKWWDDAWLNEAFAAYFQYKALDPIFPERRIMDIFVIDHVNDQSFIAEKYSGSAKPIKWNPTTNTQIERMFSQVTYAKGAGVLHMLDHMIGEDVFRDGIRRYMKAHQFTSVTTDDLWDDLQAAYDDKNPEKPLNIKEIMDPWIEQTGYPRVTVTRNNETGDIILTQKNAMSTNPNNKWKIPINYATKSNPDFSSTLPTIWFNEDDDNLTISNINKDDWIIVNIQQRGFYSVNYDEENWRLLVDCLNSDEYDKISPVNRAQLVIDSFNQIKTRNNDWEKYFKIMINVTSYLHRETDYLPWISAVKIMTTLRDVMKNTPEEEILHKYMLFLMSNMLDNKNSDYSTMKTKLQLFPLACKFGHADCQSIARKIFNDYLDNPTEKEFLEHDNEWIMCTGLEEANETLWNSFMTVFSSKYLMRTPYKFLKCSKSKEIRDKYLDRLFTMNITDSMYAVMSLFRNFVDSQENIDYMLDYFINHFDIIEKFFDEHDSDDLETIITLLDISIKNRDQYEKFKAFLEPRAKKLEEKFDGFTVEQLLHDLENAIKLSETRSAKFHSVMDEYLFGPNSIKNDNDKNKSS